MGEKLDQVYMELQQLNIQPTEQNIAIIADCLSKLREVYQELMKGGEEKCLSQSQEQPSP